MYLKLDIYTTLFYVLFRPGIPGPDSLSTLSTATELLQLLMPSNTLGVEGKPEGTTEDSEPSAMETESKEEERKVEKEKKENDGDKVEDMNVDVEEGSKDQENEKGWKLNHNFLEFCLLYLPPKHVCESPKPCKLPASLKMVSR